MSSSRSRSLLITALCCLLAPLAYAQEKPNIELVFLDNFGWGEPGFNGGGIINVAAEISGSYSREWVDEKLDTLIDTLGDVLDDALEAGGPTNEVADEIARARIAAAKA